MSILQDLIERMRVHERNSLEIVTLVPSENLLSPLARAPFLLDLYSRYFLEDPDLFGHWVFQGGREIRDIEHDLLLPMLSKLTSARWVSCKPISGLQGMWVALSAMCAPGRVALILPPSEGGHACTARILARSGIRSEFVPFEAPGNVDLREFNSMLLRLKPSVVYVDQSTFLFPLDVTELASLCRSHHDVPLYVDTSHSNGLIFGGVIANPLDQGAHGFGGSTHKTLPGPHKAIFATNDDELMARFKQSATDLISHGHSADIVALAITLAEFEECNGAVMVQRMVTSARTLGKELVKRGIPVLGEERGFTACHQLWVPAPSGELKELSDTFFAAGLHVNLFREVPHFSKPTFRLGTNEITRLGFTDAAVIELASCFADCWNRSASTSSIRARVRALRAEFARPSYCYEDSGWTNEVHRRVAQLD